MPDRGRTRPDLADAESANPRLAGPVIATADHLLPLGTTARASVFLVREGAASPRLLRLKVWHAPAAPGFLDRFDDLRNGSNDGGAVPLPCRGRVSGPGRLSRGAERVPPGRAHSGLVSRSPQPRGPQRVDVDPAGERRAPHVTWRASATARWFPATCSSNPGPEPRTSWISASPHARPNVGFRFPDARRPRWPCRPRPRSPPRLTLPRPPVTSPEFS